MNDRADDPGRVVAVIPARGGSKGVLGKNLRPVCGDPLVERAIRACRDVPSIEAVVVSTDDADIASAALRAGAEVVERPAELASDTATSESALIHVLEVLRFGQAGDVLVFVQCTSPFIDRGALANAVEMVRRGEFDSVFSARATFEFVWRTDDDGRAHGLNHDHRQRLRRQDRAPDLVETGAFYVMRADGLLDREHRFFGRVGAVVVPAWTAVEIDEQEDLELAELVGRTHAMDDAVTIDVDVLVTDFDGVHTDDSVIVREDGSESVVVSRSDGYGIDLLRRRGVRVLILSRETNPVVSARAQKLGVDCLHGVLDKWPLLRDWMHAQGVDPARVAYVGNDLNDLECFAGVGWPVAVADAHPLVRSAARVVLSRDGGAGAVREICDRIVSA